MLRIGRFVRQKMQRQFVKLSSKDTVTHFLVFFGRLTLQLIARDSGGRRHRNVRLTARTVTGT
eukprot:2619598-Lingulodinium_polyedra.AAC.1